MAQWFHGENGQQIGPVDEAQLREAIAAGRVGPMTLVWREGMPNWLPLVQVPELSGLPAPAPYGQPYAPYGMPGPQAGATCGLAIASMVCGIVSFCLCYFAVLGAIPAVICGHMALSQIRNAQVPLGGRGMAISGLVMGYLIITLTLAGIVSVIIAISTSSHP